MPRDEVTDTRRGGGVPARLSAPAGSAGAGSTPERLRIPGWLVVGATGRHAGQTELACAVIEELRQWHPIIGVMITVLGEGEPDRPEERGHRGTSRTSGGGFQICEETGADTGTGTARMLRSGARAAYRIRCPRHRLHDALAAFVPRIGSGTLVVAEGSRLTPAIEPDLLLTVGSGLTPAIEPDALLSVGSGLTPAIEPDVLPTGGGSRASSIEPGAMSVESGTFSEGPDTANAAPFTHRVVVFARGRFDLNVHHLVVIDGTWHLAEASAAILAGGASSRMGQDKSLLSLRGKPLIRSIEEQLLEWFEDVLISTNEPSRHAFLEGRIVADLEPGQGPLMGIRSVVEAARHDRVFVTACDIPVIDLDAVVRMIVLAERFDCVMPRSAAGVEPLFAVYRKHALPVMREALAAGERRISAVVPRLRAGYVDLGRASWYRNLNTREDVAAYLDSVPDRADDGSRPPPVSRRPRRRE